MVGAPSFPPGAPGKRRILLPGARPTRNSTLTDRSLILWWTFDGPGLNGTSVIDRSGNGVTGTLINGPTVVQGKVGAAISAFAGSSQYIQSAATFAHGIGTGDFTWSVWINKASSPVSYSPTLSNGSFAPALYNALATANWGLYDGSDRPSGNALPLGYWAHLVVVRSGTTLTYYQDGVKTPSTATSSINMANATFFVATDNSSWATESYDDIRVYKRALSAAEVRMLYNGPSSDLIQPIDKIWARMSATASSGRTGTLSQTLANLTSASTGTVLVSGTSTPTLSNLTSASAGTVLVQGTSTPTIAALTAASTGTVLVSGTSTPTLAALTAASTGTVLVTGSEAVTFPNLTLASAGTVLVTGTLSSTIAALTLSSTGTTPNVAVASPTIGNLTLGSAGTVLVTGSEAITIPNLTTSSAGTVLVQGTGASNFNDLTTSSAGTVLNTGVVSATLDDLTLSSSGTVLVRGTESSTIDDLTSSSAGTVLVRATLSATIDDLTLVSAGTVAASGTDTGSFVATIGPITSSSAGTVLVKGTVSSTVDDLTLSSTGTVASSSLSAHVYIIGATGDFTTIQDWITSVAGKTFGGDQELALLNEQFTLGGTDSFDGYVTSPTGKLVIRAATAAETGSVSAQHNGKAGTGARIYRATDTLVPPSPVVAFHDANVKHVVLKGVEIYSDGNPVYTTTGLQFDNPYDDLLVENCIFHTLTGGAIDLSNASGVGSSIVRNCAAWDFPTNVFCFAGDDLNPSRTVVENCTAVKSATYVTNNALGFAWVAAKNCYAGNFGQNAAFKKDFYACDSLTNCASLDPSGSGGLTGLDPTLQFVSVGGTWDLHLLSTSALRGAGTPLGDVTTDFELNPRNATTPDIGFDEWTSSLAIGTLSATIANLTLSAPGTVLDTGVVSATLAAITSASAGTVLDTGYLVSSMGNLAFSTAGTVLVTGSLSTTIANLASVSAVGTDTPVTLTKTLANLTVVSAGNVYTPVTLDQTLADLTSSSTGAVRVAGAVASTFDAITVASTATVRVTGTASQTLAALTSSSTGTVLVTGSVAKTLADLTSASAVSTDTPVRLVKTIPNLTLSSAGKVRITGTGVAHFSDLTSNSGGKVLVKGSLTKTIGPFRLHTRVIHPNSGSSDRYYLQIPRFNIDHPPSSDDLTGHLLEKLRQQQIWLDALSEAALQSANTPPLNPRYGTLRYATGDWAHTLGAVGLYIFKESGWVLIS